MLPKKSILSSINFFAKFFDVFIDGSDLDADKTGTKRLKVSLYARIEYSSKEYEHTRNDYVKLPVYSDFSFSEPTRNKHKNEKNF
jgi:hypothetical protein